MDKFIYQQPYKTFQQKKANRTVQFLLIVVLYTLLFLLFPLRPFEIFVLSLLFFMVTILEIGSFFLHRKLKKNDNSPKVKSVKEKKENDDMKADHGL